MSEDIREKKGEVIKDNLSSIISDTEVLAVQVVNSATAVLKTSLRNADEIGAMAGDLFLNTARRVVNTGSVIASDLHAATTNIIKNTVEAASEVGGNVKKTEKAPIEPKEK